VLLVGQLRCQTRDHRGHRGPQIHGEPFITRP
jgi:hypothetical protein